MNSNANLLEKPAIMNLNNLLGVKAAEEAHSVASHHSKSIKEKNMKDVKVFLGGWKTIHCVEIPMEIRKKHCIINICLN